MSLYLLERDNGWTNNKLQSFFFYSRSDKDQGYGRENDLDLELWRRVNIDDMQGDGGDIACET